MGDNNIYILLIVLTFCLLYPLWKKIAKTQSGALTVFLIGVSCMITIFLI